MRLFNKRSTTLILIILSFLLSNSCNQEDLTDTENNPKYNFSIQADKYHVSPFEIITLTIEGYDLTNDFYHATINNKEINLAKISHSQLTFLMPYFPEGEYTLNIEIEEIELQQTFTILSTEEIENPDQIISIHINNLTGAINQLVSVIDQFNLNNENQNVQIINDFVSETNNLLSSANDDEKLELAHFLQTHSDLFDFSNFDSSIFNDSLNTKKNNLNWDQKLSEDENYLTGLVIATGATILIFNGSVSSLNPIAISLSVTALLVEVLLLKSHIDVMFNRSYVPFEFDVYNDLKNDLLEFNNGSEYTLGIDGTYRTLYNGDYNSSDVMIELVANINTVTGYWNTLKNYASGISGSIPSLVNESNYEVNSHRSSVTAKYVSIKNISHPNVSIANFSNSNAVKISFQTDLYQNVNFTFDIVYNNPNFNEEVITVNAKIIVCTSTDVPTINGISRFCDENPIGHVNYRFNFQSLTSPIEDIIIHWKSSPTDNWNSFSHNEIGSINANLLNGSWISGKINIDFTYPSSYYSCDDSNGGELKSYHYLWKVEIVNSCGNSAISEPFEVTYYY